MTFLTLRGVAAACLVFLTLIPAASWACACGCGVFDVGTSSLFASCTGGTAFLDYDHMDQDRNWSGTGRAPGADNDDKEIRSDFVTLGGQYMFSRSWGVMAEVPITSRYVTTDEGAGPESFRHTALGDIRVMGVYSGFSKDMSTGLLFGLKLPTGDFTYANFDRDVGIGSGTTDSILGGYHLGAITKDAAWTYFTQATWQHPFAERAGYKPGDEVDGAIGVYYEPGAVGKPVDPGPAAAAARLLAQPGRWTQGRSAQHRLFAAADRAGIELKAAAWKLYGDVEFPVYQQVNGDQLTAPALFKVILSRSF